MATTSLNNKESGFWVDTRFASSEQVFAASANLAAFFGVLGEAERCALTDRNSYCQLNRMVVGNKKTMLRVSLLSMVTGGASARRLQLSDFFFA